MQLIGHLQPFMGCDALDKSSATPYVSTIDSVHCYTLSRTGHCKSMANHKPLIPINSPGWQHSKEIMRTLQAEGKDGLLQACLQQYYPAHSTLSARLPWRIQASSIMVKNQSSGALLLCNTEWPEHSHWAMHTHHPSLIYPYFLNNSPLRGSNSHLCCCLQISLVWMVNLKLNREA